MILFSNKYDVCVGHQQNYIHSKFPNIMMTSGVEKKYFILVKKNYQIICQVSIYKFIFCHGYRDSTQVSKRKRNLQIK